MKKKDPNQYPKGLNAAKVRAIIDHYDKQSEDEAVAEDEAAFGRGLTTVMEIPTSLVPEVLAMINRHSRTESSEAKPKRRKRIA